MKKNGKKGADIVPAVQQALGNRLKDYPDLKTTFEVQMEKNDGEWIYISVVPKKWPKRMFQLFEMLAQVEIDVEDKGFGNVLIVPARS